MKRLYIIRHAKSSWDSPGLDDFARPLNKRGETDAPRMGKRLLERDPRPDLIITSPARRAITTCSIIAECIGFDLQRIRKQPRLYLATDEQIRAIVHEQHDSNQEIMLFGHNPGLTDFVNRIGKNLRLDNLPTCGIAAFRFSVDAWKDIQWGSGELLFIDYPKAL